MTVVLTGSELTLGGLPQSLEGEQPGHHFRLASAARWSRGRLAVFGVHLSRPLVGFGESHPAPCAEQMLRFHGLLVFAFPAGEEGADCVHRDGQACAPS
jgi:hypothetical protein